MNAGVRGKPPSQPVASPAGEDLLIECAFSNELPKPPVPKLLRALPSLEKMCKYRPTIFDLENRPFILSELDLLSRVNMVDPDAYGDAPVAGSMLPPPPPVDAQLLRDDDVSEEVREAERKKRKLQEPSEALERQAFGLQLPQLITNDTFAERQRFTTGLAAAEKKMFRDPPGFGSVEELMERIEQTFVHSKEAPVHPTQRNLRPKRVLSVVPDAALWGNRYRQVIFDELPPELAPARHHVLHRSTPDPRTTCFGYFTQKEGEAGEAGVYRLQQNYFWENRGNFTKALEVGEGEGVLLSFPPAEAEGPEAKEARFVPVPAFMKLKKQKAFRLDIGPDAQALNVTYRDLSAQESEEERRRMSVVLTDEVPEEESMSVSMFSATHSEAEEGDR